MVFVLGIILFALCIGISIALHEFGHLLTAKAFGMKVTRYFIGFGPKIWSFRKGETEYGFKVIPAGGFCEIVGMTALEELDPADAPRAFWRQKVWKRVIVLSAGSITHFIVGILVLFLMALTTGLPNQNTPVVGTLSCAPTSFDTKTGKLSDCTQTTPSPAIAAGMKADDKILAVGGKNTPTFDDVLTATRASNGPTPFLVQRGDQQLTLTVNVVPVQRPAADYKLGKNDNVVTVGAIGMSPSATLHYSVLGAVPATFQFTGLLFQNTWEGLKKFPEKVPAVLRAIGGEQDVERPVSVVGASVIGGDAADQGQWGIFLLVLAGLNFFIGVFNLLPLLPLDGGHIAINLYEKVRDWIRKLRGRPAGGPVDYTRLLPLTYVVIVIGGGITLLTVAADLVNPIRLGK